MSLSPFCLCLKDNFCRIDAVMAVLELVCMGLHIREKEKDAERDRIVLDRLRTKKCS